MLLDIKDLRVYYKSDKKDIEIVRGVDLKIDKGECVGLVGESGCGKTSVGLSITKLIPEHKGSITAGHILFEGEDLLRMESDGLRKVRGKKISYVFQEPFSSLNPVFTIYEQLRESIKSPHKSDEIIENMLKDVGLEKIIGKKRLYPHELSGGMQQRAMIAMAIISHPNLLILDEPTTALDVTVQNQILDLIVGLKDKLNLSILFISHDLRTIFRLSDRICVMYAGRIVEEGFKKDTLSNPLHPYTMALIDSIPSFEHRKRAFDAIKGKAPLFSDLPKGCKFNPRCRFKIEQCEEKEPLLDMLAERHSSRCIRAKEFIGNGTFKNK